MITIKKPEEIKILREGGKILAKIMAELGQMIRPGITTGELESAARKLIALAGGRPAQLGFLMPDGRSFPAALCVSINSEIVHSPALPSRRINAGDIVSLDCVMEYPIDAKRRSGRRFNSRSALGGYYTDMALTVPAGKISAEAERLIKTTRECLALGIKQAKPGKTLNDIGTAIQKHAEAAGYGVIRELVGHGVGYSIHEEPQVPNYAFVKTDMENAVLKPGMVLAIEPMLAGGDWHIKSGKNGFTYATADNSLSAHAEHTIALTKDGCIVLTEE